MTDTIRRVWSSRPARRLRNGSTLVVGMAARGWWRNWWANAPALGSLALLLLLAGIAGSIGISLYTLSEHQATEAMVIHVYLQDGDTSGQVQALRDQLEAIPGVTSINYTSKEQALQKASQRPGLPEIAGATEYNPFPASLDVHASNPQALARADQIARDDDQATDPTLPSSYNPSAYQKVWDFLYLALGVGVAFLCLLGAVAVTVAINSVRAAVAARREEVEIMALVGAPAWMVRSPFVVEGGITGLLAGLVAGAGVVGLGLGALRATASFYALPAPGLNAMTVSSVGGLLVAGGAVVGMLSSYLGVRRHLQMH